MTGITEGREGVGRLLRQLVLWRMGFRWYLFALIGLPAIILLSVIFLPGVLASFKGLASVAPLPMPATVFTVVMTWVFNNTKGSLFMAVLVHTSFDTFLAILNKAFPVPIVNDYGSNVPVLIGFGALAVVLVASTRGRLGYQRYRDEVPDPATAAT